MLVIPSSREGPKDGMKAGILSLKASGIDRDEAIRISRHTWLEIAVGDRLVSSRRQSQYQANGRLREEV